MSRVTVKRKYGERPASKVNAKARVRNQIIEYVARNKKVTHEQFERQVVKCCASEKAAKNWMKRKAGLFNVSELETGKKVVTLSQKGMRIYDSVFTTGPTMNESSDSFMSFEEFSSQSDAKKDDEDDEDEDEGEDEVDDEPEKEDDIEGEDDEDEDDEDEDEGEDEVDERTSTNSVNENFVVYQSSETGVKKMFVADVKSKKAAQKMVDDLMSQDDVAGAGWTTKKEWDKTDDFYKVSSLESFDAAAEAISHEEDMQLIEAAENGLKENNDAEGGVSGIPEDSSEASNLMFGAFVKYRQFLENSGNTDESLLKAFSEIRTLFESFEDNNL